MRFLTYACAILCTVAPSGSAADKTLIDYFLPMPVQGKLTRDIWGADNVLPRDPENGLEDTSMKQWCYWDGQIIKAPDGKYHLFASRWDQARGHNGWFGSLAVHAVSSNASGPYKDTGHRLAGEPGRQGTQRDRAGASGQALRRGGERDQAG